MKFLMPAGGEIQKIFGVLTTPSMRGVPAGISAGLEWAADNQAFTKGFQPNVFFPWLESLKPYHPTCLFITCPDKVGDASSTLALFNTWHPRLQGWPVAFVAQDGQESLDFPPVDLWHCLFIGGSTIWKMGQAAIDCIQRAQGLGKHIHIGRVNTYRRYQHFASLPGSEKFTCDGTRQRFDGIEKTMKAWAKYMGSPKQYRLEMK